MDARIDAKINMYGAVKEFYTQNKADLDTVPAFEAAFEIFTTKYDNIKLNQQVADDSTKPSTSDKDKAKLDLATATWKVADPVVAYADSIQDIILYEAMNVSVEMLNRTKDDRMEATCQDILDQATDVKVAAAPYGLTQAMLDAATALIPVWSAKASSPRLKRAAIHAATEQVVKQSGEMDDLLERQLDRMVNTLATTKPELVSQWYVARKVLKPGTTVTQVQFLVFDKDTTEPIYLATTMLTKDGITISTATNISGEALVKPIKEGRYDIRVTMPGYVDFVLLQYRVVKGKINRITVELVAVPEVEV